MAVRTPEERTVPTSPGRLTRGLLSVAAATLLVAGCTDGGEPTTSGSVRATTTPPASSPSPSPTTSAPTVADVFRDARTASLSAESGHAKGTVTRDGATLGIDVEGRANGANQTVFITTPKGGTAEVLTVGDGYWVGGDEAHWADITGDAKAAKALVGKYAPVSQTDATELGSFTLRRLLTDTFSLPELTRLESDTGAAREVEVDGRPAYVLGKEGGPQLWVAADGSGTLLRAVGPASAPSDLTYSDWGRARTFTQPAPADLVEN
jgi:hypothetical protein